MNKNFIRLQKIAQEMKKKIAIILQHDIQDPRISRMKITLSSIEVSRDLGYAKIYVTFLNHKDKDIIKNQIGILKKASGYIRTLLSKAMYLRTIPKLTFIYDNSLVQGIKISNLIDTEIRYNKKTI